MKGWTERAKHASKVCETCKEDYKPKLRCDNTYESEVHFNASHSCSKKCSAIRISKIKKSTEAGRAEEKRRMRVIQNKAFDEFLYPGCNHATADRIRSRGFL